MKKIAIICFVLSPFLMGFNNDVMISHRSNSELDKAIDNTCFDTSVFDLFSIGTRAENKYDQNNEKAGYWCEYIEKRDVLSFIFYKGGKANGLARYYHKNEFGKYFLFAVGQYEDDFEIGQWQFFYPNGDIWLIADSCSINKNFLREAEKLGYHKPELTRQCYTIAYDTIGNITEKGWWIYAEDILANGDDVGKSKYSTNDSIK